MAERFWPGPLTLVLRRRDDAGLSLLASAGLDTVAVRVPDHPVAQALLTATGRPIAAPSANVSGRISPTTAAHVAAELDGRVSLILDGGACRVGLELTVVDLSGRGTVLLRPGGVLIEDLAAVVGPIAAAGTGPVRSPGMLRRHYAPRRPLRLNATHAGPGEALLGFGLPAAGPAVLNLSPRSDLVEAAANLFAMLRALDEAPGYSGIAVAPIPEYGPRPRHQRPSAARRRSGRTRGSARIAVGPNATAGIAFAPPALRSDSDVPECHEPGDDQQREPGRHQRQVAFDEGAERRAERPEQRRHEKEARAPRRQRRQARRPAGRSARRRWRW